MSINQLTSLKPFSFWRYGKEYFEAYLIVTNANSNRMDKFSVKFNLLCQSIEILLKAYLLTNNFTEIKLKKSFHHDLEKLFNESLKHNLDKLIVFDNEDFKLIKLLNKYYLNREFQYPKLGSKLMPYFEDIENITGKLVIAIHYRILNRKTCKILGSEYSIDKLPVESWYEEA